jgi:hypothetical protein
MTRTLGAFLLFVAAALLLASAPAQDVPAAGVQYMRARSFRVPFNVGSDGAKLKDIQLYVSANQGLSWEPVGHAPPDRAFFSFTAPSDGLYWFAVQTFDLMNRPYPQNMQGAPASVKVIVDSVLPTVSVQALAPRGNELGVSWTVRDENFNANQGDAIRLDYRSLNPGANWIPLNVPLGANQCYWIPNAAGPIDVRVQARDRAGNLGEGGVRLGPDGGASATPNPGNRYYDPTPAPATSGLNPSPSELRFVGSKRVKLEFDLQDFGPSSVKAVDLWYTQDGRSWKPHAQPVVDIAEKTMTFDLEREGQFGVRLLAKSGAGLSLPPPLAGDRPQMWIEVDLTKPEVQIGQPLVGEKLAQGKLQIFWKATDKNLASDCITLKYAEKLAETWTTIIDKLSNTGNYLWTMPKEVPVQIYLKVEAVDKAGNVGEAVTATPVNIDVAKPRAIPLKISPAQ